MDLRTQDGLERWADRMFEVFGVDGGIVNPHMLVLVMRDPRTGAMLDEPGVFIVPPPPTLPALARAALYRMRDVAREKAKTLDAVGVAVISTAMRVEAAGVVAKESRALLLTVEHKMLGTQTWMSEVQPDGKYGPRREPWADFRLDGPLARLMPAAYMN